MTVQTIDQLPQLSAALPGSERQTFGKLFAVTSMTGEIVPPPSMLPILQQYFGSVEAGLKQKVLKITNRVTLETSLFNPLRGLRPQPSNNASLQQILEEGRQRDYFARPVDFTSADVFGRVEGESCITASNMAKIDAWHSVIIFNEYNPHVFNQSQVIDYLMTAREWAEKGVERDPNAPYFFFLWNCLNKAGASQIHGHAQATLSRDMHYGVVERLRRDTKGYEAQYRRNYFTDLVSVHRALGLTVDPAERVMGVVSLTPVREREVILITDDYSPELGEAIYKTLAYFLSIGVEAFNVAIQMPPIRPVEENWAGFPVLARLVSRGDPYTRQNDVGALDLFGANVISSDPFQTANGFREWLRKNR